MSTYVISDIHGQYLAYKKMLEKIEFSDDDRLYILGDVIDRGPDGIRIIKDVKERHNAEMILGNHEFMLLNAIEYLAAREKNRIPRWCNVEGMTPLELWTHPVNGGEGTCLEFINLPNEDKELVVNYLKSLSIIKRVKIGDKMYHLSHSFSLAKKFGRNLMLSKVSHKTAENVVWESLFDKKSEEPMDEKAFAYPDDVYIVGHIFTQRLGNMDSNGKGCIYKNDNYRGYKVIDVDCGMALNSRSSRLGCYCIETGEEFYVPLLEE